MASYEKTIQVEQQQQHASPVRTGRGRKRYSSPSPTKGGGGLTKSIRLTGNLVLIVSNYRFNRDTNGKAPFVPCTTLDCDVGIKYSSTSFVADPATDERILKNDAYIFDGYGLLINVGTFLALLKDRKFTDFCTSVYEKSNSVIAEIQQERQSSSSVQTPRDFPSDPEEEEVVEEEFPQRLHHAASASNKVSTRGSSPKKGYYTGPGRKASVKPKTTSIDEEGQEQSDNDASAGSDRRRVRSFFAS